MGTFFAEAFCWPRFPGFSLLLTPNSDSSTSLPWETALYFLDPLERTDLVPVLSLRASSAVVAMTRAFWMASGFVYLKESVRRHATYTRGN